MSKKNKSKKLENDKTRMIKEEHVLKIDDKETILLVKTEPSFLPIGEIKKEIEEELEEVKVEINEEVMKKVEEIRENRWRCVIC